MPEFAEFPGEEISKTEYKRRLKQAEKARKQAGKVADAPGKAQVKEDELDADEFRSMRIKQVREIKEAGGDAYPHKFDASHDAESFAKDFKHVEHGARLDDVASIAGRVVLKRAQGSKLIFYTIMSNGASMQVVADLATASEYDFEEVNARAKRGDIVGLRGFPGRSKKGELSIFPFDMRILAPCLQMLPKSHFGLQSQDLRYRRRYMDLIVNPDVRRTFTVRSRIIQQVRRWLDERGFIEVETPMMNQIAGGAAARPFVTHHNELEADLYMRIAPELYLKQLVVGGLEKVYELGRQFRNEGVDLTHNPEFTTCEFYQAYADYEDLMRMTEHMLSDIVLKINGSHSLLYHPPSLSDPPVEIDFTPPFRRLPMVDGLRECGLDLPNVSLSSEEMHSFLLSSVHSFCPHMPPPFTVSRMLDSLSEAFLEPQCVNPTFIIDHPQVMSPLAKYHRQKEELTERFELYVNCKEIANAYTELNDPLVQREEFQKQASQKSAGDDEAQLIDETFCDALELGLPPTGGWGLGIDRLTMLLTDSPNIKEVLLFPAMRSQPGV